MTAKNKYLLYAGIICLIIGIESLVTSFLYVFDIFILPIVGNPIVIILFLGVGVWLILKSKEEKTKLNKLNKIF